MTWTEGTRDNERLKLRSAIEALEAQRALLGDEIVETALTPLREKLLLLDMDVAQPGRKLRKHATILFADITGFTALSESTDPEEITEALNSLWSRLDAIIIRNGGTVDKHIGDAVMALWGIAVSREDDPERAVKAALEMQEETAVFRSVSDQDSPVFRIRIGVHTGPVFISPVGSAGEYTAMGDTVNTADRVQASAPPGGVVISHGTYRRIAGLFAMVPRDPVEVKGKSLPLRTYLVTARNPRSFMRVNRGITGIETAMVGRETELNTLVEAYQGAMADRRSVLITITGDAGVGKSRLLFEFRRLAADELKDTAVFSARCTPGTENTPCYVFRDMLRQRFGIHEDDSVEEVIGKLERGMAGILDDEESHLAGHFAGYDLSSSDTVSRLDGSTSLASLGRAALVRFFRETASGTGAVLYLEDIHWADPLSLDLVREFASGAARGPMFMVALARPALLEREPDWIEGMEGVLIRLNSLSGRETAELIGELLDRVKGPTDEIRSMIADSSEGNPFYVEELIKMLIDDGVIVRTDEEWTVSPGGLVASSIPATLTGVLQARLDSLPEEERELLQRASVVGRLFWDMTVRSLSGSGPETDLPHMLESIQTRDLVYLNDGSAFSQAREYIFKHAVLRDVTYETVLLRLRRVYHEMVAAWLVENSGERVSEFEGLIAEHFERAGNSEQAMVWLTRSGRSAYTTSAYNEALSYFGRVSDLLPEDSDPAVRADLLYRIGCSLEKLSRYDESWDILEEALKKAEEADSSKIAAEILITLTWIATIRGLRSRAEELAVLALSRAEESGDRSTLARAIMRMSDYEEDRTYEKLLSYYKRGNEMYRELGDRNGIAISLLNMGNIAMDFREFLHARDFYTESLETYEIIGNRWGVANCLGNLGNVESGLGNYAEAMDLHRRSMAMSIGIGDVEGEVICNLNLGMDFCHIDQPGESLEHSRRAVDLALPVGLIPLALAGLSQVAEWMESAGRLESAALILFAMLQRSDQIPPQNIGEVREALDRVIGGMDESEIHRIRSSATGLTLEEASGVGLNFRPLPSSDS